MVGATPSSIALFLPAFPLLLHGCLAPFAGFCCVLAAVFFFLSTSACGEFDPEVFAQRVVDSLRANAPQGTQIHDVLGLVNRNFYISPPASQRSSAEDRLTFISLDVPDAFLQFLATALRFAILPRSCRHPTDALFSWNPKSWSCSWISRQIRIFAADSSQGHVKLISKLRTVDVSPGDVSIAFIPLLPRPREFSNFRDFRARAGLH